MGATTAINWTSTVQENGTITPGATWNPLTGCTQISPGCAKCYAKELAEGMMQRTKSPRYINGFSLTLHPDLIDLPRKWKTPRKIFVNSMSDLFHKDVPIEFIQRVFDTMNETPRHTYQILTKRHERLAEIAAKGLVTWSPNIWQGVSIENNRFVVRAEFLKIVPAAIRFLSCEPLLTELTDLNLNYIDWVICGGESGPRYRPLNLDHARHLRDLCILYGVPFWFKQIGGRKPDSNGRLLDGRTWDQMPELASKGA